MPSTASPGRRRWCCRTGSEAIGPLAEIIQNAPLLRESRPLLIQLTAGWTRIYSDAGRWLARIREPVEIFETKLKGEDRNCH